jgi:hypothetical protein
MVGILPGCRAFRYPFTEVKCTVKVMGFLRCKL